jgi:hypothetical protein
MDGVAEQSQADATRTKIMTSVSPIAGKTWENKPRNAKNGSYDTYLKASMLAPCVLNALIAYTLQPPLPRPTIAMTLISRRVDAL